MEIIKLLLKIVENPKSIKNYQDLGKSFKEKGRKDISEALDYLIEKKNVTNNSDNDQ